MAGLPVRLTTEPDGSVALASPYDAELVARLKRDIPYNGRSWEPSRKQWLISPLYETDLLRCLNDYGCSILDARAVAATTPVRVVHADDPYKDMPADLRQALQTLYLSPEAPLLVAEASHRALARVYHPDNKNYGDQTIFLAVQAAIEVVRRYLDNDGDDIPF